MSMYRRRFLVCCLGLAAFAVAGCQTGAPLTLTVPATKTVSADTVPWHAKAAVSAVEARLRGTSEQEVERNKGVRGSGAVEPEPRFRYDGFTVHQVTFSRFAALDGQPPGRLAAGFLNFRDDAGRRASVAFNTDYRAAKDAIAIERAAWSPVFSAFPKVEMHVLPGESIKDIATAAGDSYLDFHAAVLETAVRLDDPEAVPGERRDYVIVVFLKDRIAPDAKFEVRISSSKRFGAAGHKDATRYRRYDDGWIVAVVPGSFALTSANAFWVKVVFTPGSDVPEEKRGERIIGLFSTDPTEVPAASAAGS